MKRLNIRLQLTLWYSLTMAITLIVLAVILLLIVKFNIQIQINTQLDHKLNLLIGEFIREPSELVELEHNGIVEWFSIEEIQSGSSNTTYDAWSIYDSTQWSNEGLDIALNYITKGQILTWNHVNGQIYHIQQYNLKNPINSAVYLVSAAVLATESYQWFNRLKTGLWFILPFALLLSSFGGYWIAGRALRPLNRITQHIEHINSDHLSTRLKIKNPYDELGRLVVALNHALGRIDHSFHQLKKFTTDAAHQLRTPLTAIRSVGELSIGKSHSSDGYKTTVLSMLEEASKLENIVESLLILARADSNQTPANIQVIPSLHILLDSLVEMLQILADEKQQNIILVNESTSEGNNRVMGDQSLLKQGLINILENAIYYTQNDGNITLSTKYLAEQKKTVITITDDGPGISQEDAPYIFDRFYRGKSKHKASGTGLGLSLAKELIRLSGGELKYIKNDENTGAIFQIELSLQ